jgi:hypothetical protein
MRWTSPNGRAQTAVRIPCTGTRSSFRKSAMQTCWIEQVTESMLNKEKVLPEVGVEWLIEAIFDRHRPQFESFCERKGFLPPTQRLAAANHVARMPKGKSAAMGTDGNVSNNPDLKDITEKVKAQRKRKAVKQMARRKVKSECRARNLESEIENVKGETIVTGHIAAIIKRDSL